MLKRTKIRMALVISGAALMTACGAGNEAAADNNSAEVPEAAMNAPVEEAAAPAPVAAQVGGAPDTAYMVGKWSAMDEDCADVLDFRKDGTVETPIGEAKWTLENGNLTFDYGDGSTQPSSSIKVLSPDRIEITRASGGKETEKRC